MQRQDGYYNVAYAGGYEIAYYTGKNWLRVGDGTVYPSFFFSTVDEMPISLPVIKNVDSKKWRISDGRYGYMIERNYPIMKRPKWWKRKILTDNWKLVNNTGTGRICFSSYIVPGPDEPIHTPFKSIVEAAAQIQKWDNSEKP